MFEGDIKVGLSGTKERIEDILAGRKQIKVFGERNTGSRAVIRMIDASSGLRGAGHPGVSREVLQPFRDRMASFDEMDAGPWKRVYKEAARDSFEELLGPVGAWKHTAPVFSGDFAHHDVSVLFLVRNPYSWALSLHRQPYHIMGPRRADLLSFFNEPWLTLGRDRVERILISPLDLWSLKLAAYRRFERNAEAAGVPFATLRFEDFVADPAGALTASLQKLGDGVTGIEVLEAPTKPNGMDAKTRQNYYGRETWKADLTAQAVSFINARVDWELAQSYGYQRLDPDDFPSN